MKQDYQNLIKDSGLKVTKSRLGVLADLSSQDRPSDAQEIHQRLVKQGMKLDQATVYRILEKFQALDIVKPVNFEDGKIRFELADHHHHHMVCEDCGAIEIVEDCEIEKISDDLAKKHKFHITRHSLEFFGLCHNCDVKRIENRE